MGLFPGLATMILHAAQRGQKKKKNNIIRYNIGSLLAKNVPILT